MSNTDELIARLRDWSDGPDTDDLCRAAAEALTAQAREIERLRAAALGHETNCMTKAREIESLRADAERWRIGHDRYETVRLLSVPQFQDAYVLNRRTGKPFDEIIDDLRPFKQYDINKRAGKAVTP